MPPQFVQRTTPPLRTRRPPGDAVTSADRVATTARKIPSDPGWRRAATRTGTGATARRGSCSERCGPASGPRTSWSSRRRRRRRARALVGPVAGGAGLLHLLRRRLGALPHQRRARRRAGPASPGQTHAAGGQWPAARAARHGRRGRADRRQPGRGRVAGPVGLRPRRGVLPRADRRLQPVAEAPARHGAGARRLRVRAARRGRRRRRPRVPLDVVPRLHLVRRALRRHGQALRRARAPRREPRGTTAACSTSTPSRSFARR